MAKLFLQPYFILLFSATAMFIWILIKYREILNYKIRRLMWIGIVLLGIMWVFSIPIVSEAIERSLYLNPSVEYFSPEVIAILSGGYELGYSKELDVLVIESNMRVLNGVKWWKEHPDAIMVMSGADHSKLRKASRQTELMIELAQYFDVPRYNLIADTLSRTTREHPQKILELPSINKQTKIGIVTSNWHMRRALFSFKQYFEQVYPSPIPVSLVDNTSFSFQQLIPCPDVLSKTTTMIHEWIGLLWYKLIVIVK